MSSDDEMAFARLRAKKQEMANSRLPTKTVESSAGAASSSSVASSQSNSNLAMDPDLGLTVEELAQLRLEAERVEQLIEQQKHDAETARKLSGRLGGATPEDTVEEDEKLARKLHEEEERARAGLPPKREQKSGSDGSDAWCCTVCTYENNPMHLVCAMCMVARDPQT